MLFLDTEWADMAPHSQLIATTSSDCELVSLGLFSLDARWQFYCERKLLPVAPAFVRSVVYPLLQRGEFALPDEAISQALRAFIAKVAAETQETPTIAYDFWNDRSLFLNAWGGLDSPLMDATPPAVQWYELNQLDPHYSIGLERHFADHADSRKRQHHALIDAEAARAGYLYAVQQLASPTSR